MTTLQINRPKEYINRFRKYSIELDGQQLGTIANGESKEIIITSGMHKLTFRIDWCSSPDFEFYIENGQTQTVRISGFKHSRWIMPLALGLGLLGILLDGILGSYTFVYITAPLFLLLFYHLTLGRNDYLTITTT